MKTRLNYIVISLIVLLSACVAQQKENKKCAVVSKTGQVELVFTPMVDTAIFRFDRTYISPNGEPFKIHKIKFFISDVACSSSNMPESSAILKASNGVYLVDFSEATIDSISNKLSASVGFDVAEGRYSDIRFNLGLPRALNHADPTMAPAPLDLAKADMFWEWNSGYIFLLIEGESSVAEDSLLHFAIGSDARIMPFSFGDIFDAVPLVQVKENGLTRVHFSFDLNKLFINGDGSAYSFKSPDASDVHGGYWADVLRINTLKALEFNFVE
jgi:hypothetical protein